MGSFKLGKMTLKGLFQQPETIQYPTQTKPQPAGLKGHIAIEVDNCILCGICAKRCPCSAIEVDKATRKWSVDGFRCIQCSICVRDCPKGCLTLAPSYTPPATQKHASTYEIPEKVK